MSDHLYHYHINHFVNRFLITWPTAVCAEAAARGGLLGSGAGRVALVPLMGQLCEQEP